MVYPTIDWTTGRDERIDAALYLALKGSSKLPKELLTAQGMSGYRYRMFINNLLEMMPGVRYLEIGLHHGSTFCAAIHGNDVDAVGIDNWSQYGAERSTFEHRLSKAEPKGSVHIITADFRKVDFTELGPFEVYFFDGPHEEDDQKDALVVAYPALADTFIFIVDDWNAESIRHGTFRGIEKCGLTIESMLEIRTAPEGSPPTGRNEGSEWHEGVMVAVLKKGN